MLHHTWPVLSSLLPLPSLTLTLGKLSMTAIFASEAFRFSTHLRKCKSGDVNRRLRYQSQDGTTTLLGSQKCQLWCQRWALKLRKPFCTETVRDGRVGERKKKRGGGRNAMCWTLCCAAEEKTSWTNKQLSIQLKITIIRRNALLSE